MKSDFSVNMNEYLPLRDVVFNTLRQAILKGELKPGERLMEIALAERLGVSRTSFRSFSVILATWAPRLGIITTRPSCSSLRIAFSWIRFLLIRILTG